MASLAQYAATLHQTAEAAMLEATRPEPGTATKLVGLLIYSSVFALVAVAALLQAG